MITIVKTCSLCGAVAPVVITAGPWHQGVSTHNCQRTVVYLAGAPVPLGQTWTAG